jgi:hypothetical protein
MLGYQITRFSICVPLTDEQWNRLDNWGHDAPNPYDEQLKLIKMLEDVGAYDVDWNGHFGQNIFFTADADFETCEYGRTHVEAVVKKIEELLQCS